MVNGDREEVKPILCDMYSLTCTVGSSGRVDLYSRLNCLNSPPPALTVNIYIAHIAL